MRKSTPTLLALAAAALLSTPAMAQPGPGPGFGHGPDFGPPGAERETRERIRTMRAISLANHLDLDEREALRMNATMRRFDEQREKIRESTHAAFKVLERAGRAKKGKKVDAKQIEQALEAVLKGQERMAELRREEFAALAKELNPLERARLAIFLRDFPKQVRKAMRQRRGKHGRGAGGGGGGGPPEFAPFGEPDQL